MSKTLDVKKISLASRRAGLDQAEIAYQRACDLADRHNQLAQAAIARGDAARHDYYTMMAHRAGDRALAQKERIVVIRAQLERAHKILGRARAAATATPPPPKESGGERRTRLKRELTEGTARSQAGLPSYDPRTAAGQREHHIEALGAKKRARTRPYADLFLRKANATPERLAACDRYEELVRTSQEGLFPEPAFEPRVDSSNIQSSPLANAAALVSRDALRAYVGVEGEALLYLRIIDSRSARSLASEAGDERQVQAKFTAAVDAAARFFGLLPRMSAYAA